MNFTNFLTVDDVLKIHEQQLLHFGGAPGVGDRSGLEAAVQQPQASTTVPPALRFGNS
jgi:hypothetical protein